MTFANMPDGGIKLRLAEDWHRGSGLAGLEWQIGYVMCEFILC